MTGVLRLVLVGVTVGVLAGLPLVAPVPGLAELGSVASTAAASPALDNGNDNNSGAENDNRDEFQIEGTILSVACPDQFGQFAEVCGGLQGVTIPAINRGSTPPDIYVHNVDGPVRVVFRDPARLDQFEEGQYVRIDGQRISQFLFEAESDDNDIDIVQGPALRPGGGDNGNGNSNGNGNGNGNDNDINIAQDSALLPSSNGNGNGNGNDND